MKTGSAMNEHAISISLSEDEQAFIDAQVASGRFADEREALHAGLASLARDARLGALYPIAAGGDAVGGYDAGLEESGALTRYIAGHAPEIAEHLRSSELGGVSGRRIPDIIADVKTKLRADGKL